MIYDICSGKNTRMVKVPVDIDCRDGQYGLVGRDSREVILPHEYDNIFVYGFDLFALCRKGKWGAVAFDRESNRCPDKNGVCLRWVAHCEYDTLDERDWDLFFSRSGEQRWYNSFSGQVRSFGRVRFYGSGDRYLFAEDQARYFVFDRQEGRFLWASGETDGFPLGAPCLAFMGEAERLPVFEDVTNGAWLLPVNGRLTWTEALPSPVLPIMINGRNLANIVSGPEGLGVMDLSMPVLNRSAGPEKLIPVDMTCKSIRVETHFIMEMDGETNTLVIETGSFAPGDFLERDW